LMALAVGRGFPGRQRMRTGLNQFTGQGVQLQCRGV
jgi:hypothetical protein